MSEYEDCRIQGDISKYNTSSIHRNHFINPLTHNMQSHIYFENTHTHTHTHTHTQYRIFHLKTCLPLPPLTIFKTTKHLFLGLLFHLHFHPYVSELKICLSLKLFSHIYLLSLYNHISSRERGGFTSTVSATACLAQ